MKNFKSLSRQLCIGSLSGMLLVSCGSSGGDDDSGSSSSSSSASSSSSSSSASSSSASSSSSSSSSSGYPSGPPVATAPPDAPDQTPAFAEQTRAPEITTAELPQRSIVTASLDSPWGMVFLPDGRLLVTEIGGDMHIVSADGSVSPALAGLPELFTQGQGGLLDVTLAPDFSETRELYFTFAEPREGNTNGAAVARATLAEDESGLEDVDIIARQTPAWNSNLHFGSRVVFDPDGYLFVTFGERSLPEPRQLSQDINTTLGKVLRLNRDGSAPEANPFVGTEGEDVIWSYGHRNPQGAAIDPDTGLLWTLEHGPQGGDELNQPEPGVNYGWPVVTYGEDYNGRPIGSGVTAMEGIGQPVYYWDPVIAPADFVFYRGEMFPEWSDSILIGGLASQALTRLYLAEGRVRGEERLYVGEDRIRDVDVAADGSVWYITDDGEVYRLHR